MNAFVYPRDLTLSPSNRPDTNACTKTNATHTCIYVCTYIYTHVNAQRAMDELHVKMLPGEEEIEISFFDLDGKVGMHLHMSPPTSRPACLARGIDKVSTITNTNTSQQLCQLRRPKGEPAGAGLRRLAQRIVGKVRGAGVILY